MNSVKWNQIGSVIFVVIGVGLTVGALWSITPVAAVLFVMCVSLLVFATLLAAAGAKESIDDGQPFSRIDWDAQGKRVGGRPQPIDWKG